ncbi:MAG: UDP-N-acetylmuramoyl-tripeptide--D-alanyl-D-alanine ligase, partial [Sphingobacteriales bacterium]
MARYSIQEIISLVRGHAEWPSVQVLIDHLVTDTRKITDPAGSVFFAIHGDKRDGHVFIPEAYQQGVRVFVVSKEGLNQQFPDAVFILVEESLQALQQLAAAHRASFDIPVIGITGSNGKTIVKEWLNHLLEPSFSIVRSPRSYNSQLGVPLSVWPMAASHSLAIFEAGISQAGEMQKLEPMIRPSIGVFTNIGDAHSEGFSSMEEKIREKLQLFAHSRQLIYPADQVLLSDEIKKFASSRDIRIIGWGKSALADLQLLSAEPSGSHTTIHYRYQDIERQFTIPFTGTIAEENAMTCAAVLELLGTAEGSISMMKDIPSLSMRLDMRQGINHCTIINDSYSADLDSLKLALDFLRQQRQHRKRTLILSDLLQSGKKEEDLYTEIAGLVKRHALTRFVGIGNKINAYADLFRTVVPQAEFYADTTAFIQSFSQTAFQQETILLKGARAFSFEKISALLETKWHQTVLQVNLSAVAQNLTTYRNILQKGTKIMVMVKAFSYGSGSFEIANLLQFHKVDYLAVAYADEGVELRRAGIRLPIMVMNPEEAIFAALVNDDLQPEIFSFQMLDRFNQFLQREGIQEFPVHLKIDTGMHRLGFAP